MVSTRCTPLTFLLTGFTWLLLAALLGMGTLLGLIYGTPLPSWLKTVHVHGVLIGGLLQLVIGGFLAAVAFAEERQEQSVSRPGLFLAFNGATITLLLCFGYGRLPLAGIVGLALSAIMASLVKPAWDYVQENLAGRPNPSWTYLVTLGSVFIGLLIGVGLALQLAPEYRAHARLLHLHMILLGFFTVLGVTATHVVLPAVLKITLYSVRLSHITTASLIAGFTGLLTGFVTSSPPFELAAGCFVLIAVALYAFNLFRTWMASGLSGSAASDHLLIGAMFLLLVSVAGMLMGLNFLPEKPLFPIGSLHLSAYTHLAFLGFMINTICGVLSYGLPLYLAATQVPNRKKRGLYREQLETVMNRWRAVQLMGISLGTLGLVVTAALTWSAPLSALSVRLSTWAAIGLLVGGLTVFAAKLAWITGLRPVQRSSS